MEGNVDVEGNAMRSRGDALDLQMSRSNQFRVFGSRPYTYSSS